MQKKSVAIIGGGLAGCECALALAEAGIESTIFEMKPHSYSEAHTNPDLAELVCSNSFRSNAPESAIGELKEEMRLLGSATMKVAEKTKVPAGKALAVDRSLFAASMTELIETNQLINLVREEVPSLDASEFPRLAKFSHIAVCAGPMASLKITESLQKYIGQTHLYFFDAIAPVVDGASIDMNIAFWGARYMPEDTDYLNCPMNKEEYYNFYNALLAGEKVVPKAFEKEIHFEGCMPLETLAERGEKTLLFGSLKPVGFTDPRTQGRPYALLQLRAENANKTMFNLVGCQTKLTFPEQDRIFRLIPGLQHAEFVRFGSMHRNTFVNAPQALNPNLSLKAAPHIYLAGQITGVEGYVESAACGLWLGKILRSEILGLPLSQPPIDTALGALLAHLQTPVKNFQPSNVQFGLMPELGLKAKKAERKALYAQRANQSFALWLRSQES